MRPWLLRCFVIAAALFAWVLPVTGIVSATPAGAISCHTGSNTWSVGPAGGSPLTWAQVVFNTNDSPPGCTQLLVRILSTGGNTYRSGPIKQTGITSQAHVKDRTQIAKAWLEEQPNALPQFRQCRQIYPTVETAFHSCTGIKTVTFRVQSGHLVRLARSHLALAA
jgi:hypothetical protein